MFKYQLEFEDGTSAGQFATAVPNWKVGDTIPLGRGRSLRVVEPREDVLVVEPATDSRSTAASPNNSGAAGQTAL